jgi:hypothetical protein
MPTRKTVSLLDGQLSPSRAINGDPNSGNNPGPWVGHGWVV